VKCLLVLAVLLSLFIVTSAVADEPEVMYGVAIPVTATGNFAAVAAGDIDKDGYAEILSGRRDGEEGLFLFTYIGNTWGQRQITMSGEYGGVALADVTGDKVLDILAVKTKGNPMGLEILRTELAEGTMKFEQIQSPFTQTSCDDLDVGDVESDGDLDIVVSTGGKGVLVLLNDGKGSSFTSLQLATKTYEDTGIALGDINHDGRLDVIASNHPGENPRLFLCSSSGEVSYDSGHTGGLVAGPGIGYDIAIADFNTDGFNDLAIGSAAGLHVYLGNGCEGPDTGWWRDSPVTVRGRDIMQLSVGDLNRDGKPDLAFASDSGIFALVNRYPEGFSPKLDAGLPDKGRYSGCCLFDFEGDGILDIAISSLQGLGVHLYRGIRKKH